MHVSDFPPELIVIVVVPTFFAVTSPPDVTVAVAGVFDLYVTALSVASGGETTGFS